MADDALVSREWLNWLNQLKQAVEQPRDLYTESIVDGKPLTKTDDTNVTLTLGGTPATALLQPVSLTLGWTGLLGLARGGTHADLSATGGAKNYLKQASVGADITVGTIPASDIVSGAALTRVNDTNVTLTLGGTPASALLVATSLTLGWTGTLALARGGTGADLSATGGTKQYVKQATLGGAFTVGTIPASDIASGAALTKADDTNVTLTLGGTPTTALLVAASITAGWTGTLAVARGGIGVGTLASNGVLYGNGTSAVQALAVNATATRKFLVQVSSAAPIWDVIATGDLPAGSVTGSGTVQHLAKWTSTGSTLGDSIITDSGATVTVGGSFVVGASKFTVLSATGNTDVAGTLQVESDFSVGTIIPGKFNVTASSGDTSISGILGVTGATTLNSTLGVTAAATLSSTLAVNGATITLTNAAANLIVKISGGVTMTLQPGSFGTSSNDGWLILANNGTAGKVHASKGLSWGDTTDPGNTNFRVAGTLTVVGTSGLAAVNMSGDLAIATSKFTVAAATGNTLAAGTLDATGNFNVNTNKFQVTATTGNTLVAGTLSVNGTAITLTNASANLTVVGTSVTMTIQPGFFGTSSASPNGAFTILIGNATGGKFHDSKGFSWGDTTDPGATNFRVAGTSTLVGTVTHAGQTIFTPVVTVNVTYDGATKTHACSPGSATFVYVTNTGAVTGAATITGFSGGTEGRILILSNVQTQPIVLSVEDATEGTTTNRISGTVSKTIMGNGGALLVYDNNVGRWRIAGFA